MKTGETVTAEVDCSQLEHVHKSLLKSHAALTNQYKVLPLHDNARPHVVKKNQMKLMDLDMESSASPAIFTRYCSFRLSFI
jgi:hypothetical protein